jgi:hypothetical protein
VVYGPVEAQSIFDGVDEPVDHLERALALNPQFDLLQARIAREALTK